MTAILKVLFIDDNSIDEELDTINRALARNNIRIDATIIDMKNPLFLKERVTGSSILSPIQIQEHLSNSGIMDTDFDIVACDFNFSDPYFDGYKLLTKLINLARSQRKLIRKAKFIFYTGDTADLEKIAGSDLKKLLPLKVELIVDREHLPDKLIRLINSIKSEIDLEKMFINYLEEHSDKNFVSTFTPFAGKNFSQISKEIEKGTENGKAFLESLIEQSVSHLIDLQED